MSGMSAAAAVQVAAGWHGGQFSPLYSFASTGGKVQGEEHKRALLAEIDANIERCKKEQTTPDVVQRRYLTGQIMRLMLLRDYVEESYTCNTNSPD